MNLHIVPDDKYINRFVERLHQLGLSGKNTFLVKSQPPYKYVSASLSGALIGSDAFKDIISKTPHEKLFIHFMDEDSINVVINSNCKNIHWLAWGADIYETLYGSSELLDEETHRLLDVSLRSKTNRLVYKTAEKIAKYNKFRKAYSKISVLGNWIEGEYDYAISRLPGLKARHQQFIYDVDIPFRKLDQKIIETKSDGGLRVLLGQSTVPAGNHMSALEVMRKQKYIAEVIIPASYGSTQYRDRLEEAVGKLTLPFEVTFLKTYHSFEEYIALLATMDVVVLNSIRPAGLGNFWIGIFLGKAVFIRKENLACAMFRKLGLKFFTMDEWNENPPRLTKEEVERNRQKCFEFFAEERIAGFYTNLFS